MIGCGDDDLTLTLISNAAMETFPGNKLSNFTTLLPTPMTLVGGWQVALLEISWPAMVRNVTEGKITVSKIVPSPQVALQAMSHIISSRRSGMVSMRVPPQFRKEPALEFSTSKVRYIKAGCYSSIDDIMDAIMKSATRNDKENSLSPTNRESTEAASPSGKISWKVDRATQELQVKFCGNVEQHGLVIQALSQDLINILGMITIIDCQNSELPQDSKENLNSGFHEDQQHTSDLTVVKTSGQWPVDVNAGSQSHNVFVLRPGSV